MVGFVVDDSEIECRRVSGVGNEKRDVISRRSASGFASLRTQNIKHPAITLLHHGDCSILRPHCWIRRCATTRPLYRYRVVKLLAIHALRLCCDVAAAMTSCRRKKEEDEALTLNTLPHPL